MGWLCVLILSFSLIVALSPKLLLLRNLDCAYLFSVLLEWSSYDNRVPLN